MNSNVYVEFLVIGDAGLYDLVICDNGITENMRVIISSGQPLKSALREAEILATALNCKIKKKYGNTLREPFTIEAEKTPI